VALRVRRAGGEPKPSQCHAGQEPGWEATARKGPLRAGQVSDEKTNASKPLLTHRNLELWHQNRGRCSTLGQRRMIMCALSQEGACLLSWRCPVFRWRELVAGAGTEQENLSPRYRRSGLCCLVARGRPASGRNRERQSTVGHRGGSARSSDEGPVMRLERRGRAGQVTQRPTPDGGRS
jgi:hypothetical protein